MTLLNPATATAAQKQETMKDQNAPPKSEAPAELSSKALLAAIRVTGHTLVGVGGKPPHERGNCFGVETDDGKEYKIVNFVYENLEHLLKNGLTWPVKIAVLAGRTAIIHDERIPDNWYSDRYCEVCCPESLLPYPQIARHKRQEARGERIVGNGIITIILAKRPTLAANI